MGILFNGCISYYQRNIVLMNAYDQKDYKHAEEILSTKKWEKRKRNLLLYYLNKGTVLHMLQQYQESNTYFQLADYYIEDYHRNYALTAVSNISNPSVEHYKGENFEQILVHYYSTINYLQMGMLDEALVECKRMQLKMQFICDFYKKENKYNKDAFSYLLLGIVYDAQKDYNNAFIAYRNAYEVYKDNYKTLLGTDVPLQLKKDLLRTAYLTGFDNDVALYEKEFGFNYNPKANAAASVVCFWNNGKCPVKERNNIDFIINRAGNGWVNFVNLELGLTFPFYVGEDKAQENKLIDLKIMRVSFPKFVSRLPLYSYSYIHYNNDTIPFYLAENIDAIAHRSLNDRMWKELSSALLRMAVKKTLEMSAEKADPNLGTAVNIINALTENADTRSWQTLPFSINYTRLNLEEGANKFAVVTKGINNQSCIDSVSISIKKNQTKFCSFYTLD